MEDELQVIEKFCENEIKTYIEKSEGNLQYPSDILKKLGKLGVFGINIPKEYGGSKLPISLNLQINKILSKYWLSIPALLGTHLRANQYFVELATDKQKEKYLPLMAAGEFIVAHAFHEKSIKNPLEFDTHIVEKNGEFFLTGTKEWVTNASDCDSMIVVARREVSGENSSTVCSAVLIQKDRAGVSLAKDHHRTGVMGVSLQRVNFDNVAIDKNDFIGGPEISVLSFISQFRAISSLNFSSRCVGVAESIVDLIKPYLMVEKRDKLAQGVICYKFSEVVMLKESITSYFEKSVSLNTSGNLTKAEAHRTKVYCSQTLQDLVQKARMLAGGTGFASDDEKLIRQLNDAVSLSLIDTPNDILLTWSGMEDLNVTK